MALRMTAADWRRFVADRMIREFRNRSFPLVVDALVALGRIQYRPAGFIDGRWVSERLVFNPYGGVWVTLCKYGHLCSKPECRFHHLNRDYLHISQDFPRCAGYGDHGTDKCSLPDECGFRHEEKCNDAIWRDLCNYPSYEFRAQYLERTKTILQNVFDYYSRTGDFEGNAIKRDAAFVGLGHMRFYPYLH